MTLPIPGIPREAAAMFARLCSEPSVSVEVLRSELREHLVRISGALAANEFLDGALATAIAKAAEGLLDESVGRDSHDRALVQAAVRYFVLDDDADHDLESVCGLDDDAAVCNAVARALGRADLAVET